MNSLPVTLSDLEIVIRGADLLDCHLNALLAQALYGTKAAQDNLLTNSARMRTVGYCLGLLTDQEFQDLATIGCIRNAFAHPRGQVVQSFDNLYIRTRLGGLSIYRKEEKPVPRRVFIESVSHLVRRLECRTIQVKQHKQERKLDDKSLRIMRPQL